MIDHKTLRMKPSLLAAALLAAWVQPACAVGAVGKAGAAPRVQDIANLSLESLLDLQVTGASRQAQRMSEAAASVSVITREELRALGYRHIADALRSLRGLSVAYDRSYTYLGVRGFYAPSDYNTRVLLLVDGNRVNDIVFDQGFIGHEAPLDIDQVERIEFIPGQGAAVYGANALFGVINVVTRAPTTPGSSAALRIGSGGEREVMATWQRGEPNQPSGVAWLIAASRRVHPGVGVVVPNAAAAGFAGDVVAGIDHEQLSRVRFAVQGEHWRANVLHAARGKGYGAPEGLVLGDPRSVNRDTQTLADATWQQAWGTHGHWQARVFAVQYRYQGDFVVDYPPVTLNRDDASGRWWGAEARLATSYFAGHALQFGLELQRSGKVAQTNRDLEGDHMVYLDTQTRRHRLGVYAEDRIELGRDWSATLGLRADHASTHDVVVNPRLALIWRPNETLVLKLVHGSAFRPPTAFESDYVYGGSDGYVRNPALKPEKVRGQELIAEWQARRDVRVTLAAYQTLAQQLMVLQPVGPDSYSFQNTGAAKLRGLEAELQWQGSGGWRARASLSLQRPQFMGSSEFTEQSPRQMAKATVVAPLPDGWLLGLDAQAQSRRGEAAGHAVVNAHLSRAIAADTWRIGFGLRNLFNRAYADPGAPPESPPSVRQDGRKWSLQVTMPW